MSNNQGNDPRNYNQGYDSGYQPPKNPTTNQQRDNYQRSQDPYNTNYNQSQDPYYSQGYVRQDNYDYQRGAYSQGNYSQQGDQAYKGYSQGAQGYNQDYQAYSGQDKYTKDQYEQNRDTYSRSYDGYKKSDDPAYRSYSEHYEGDYYGKKDTSAETKKDKKSPGQETLPVHNEDSPHKKSGELSARSKTMVYDNKEVTIDIKKERQGTMGNLSHRSKHAEDDYQPPESPDVTPKKAKAKDAVEDFPNPLSEDSAIKQKDKHKVPPVENFPSSDNTYQTLKPKLIPEGYTKESQSRRATKLEDKSYRAYYDDYESPDGYGAYGQRKTNTQRGPPHSFNIQVGHQGNNYYGNDRQYNDYGEPLLDQTRTDEDYRPPESPEKSFDSKDPAKEEEIVSLKTDDNRRSIFSYIFMSSFGYSLCDSIVQSVYPNTNKVFEISEEQFDHYWTNTFFPLNIIFLLLGGILIDRIGVGKIYKLALLMLTAGHIIVLGGAAYHRFTILIVGKVIIEMMKQPLLIAQVVIVFKWFKGTESFSTNIGVVFFLGNSSSSFGALFFTFFANSVEEMFILLFVAPLFICLLGLISYQAVNLDSKAEALEETEEKNQEKFQWKDLLSPSMLYYLFVLYFALIGAGSEVSSANFYFTMWKEFDYVPTAPNLVYFVIGIHSGSMIYRFGNIVHNKGGRVFLMIATALLFIITNSTLLQLKDRRPHPVNVGIWIIATGISIYRAARSVVYLPVIALLVKQRIIATAYSFCFVIAFLVNYPLMSKTVSKHSQSHKDDYNIFRTQVIALILISCSVIVAFFIHRKDVKHSKELSKKGSEYVDSSNFGKPLFHRLFKKKKEKPKEKKEKEEAK